MELFTKDSAVRLRSCHGKYLFADDDEKSVRQSSDRTSRQSIWTVEMVPRKPKLIRLKSCFDKYLTASESSFLLGMTGGRVIQTLAFRQAEHESDWEPIRDDLPVKLMSWSGKYLRGNGGTPPWKNSVTHDSEPYMSTTKKWFLWSVEVVENLEKVPIADRFSTPTSSFNSTADETNHGSPDNKLPTFESAEPIGSDPGSIASVSSSKLMLTPSISESLTHERKHSKKIVEHISAIEIFRDAKLVRLRNSEHEKYLIANDIEESVKMGHNGSSKEAQWKVEMVPGSEKAIRLKSCHGGYLTASNERFLLGATGHKVIQSRKIRTGEPAGEWEPVKEGLKVKLRSRNGGSFLRANGGLPPWKNTVTHDSPNLSTTQSWVVWDVDVIERSHGTG